MIDFRFTICIDTHPPVAVCIIVVLGNFALVFACFEAFPFEEWNDYLPQFHLVKAFLNMNISNRTKSLSRRLLRTHILELDRSTGVSFGGIGLVYWCVIGQDWFAAVLLGTGLLVCRWAESDWLAGVSLRGIGLVY